MSLILYCTEVHVTDIILHRGTSSLILYCIEVHVTDIILHRGTCH